MKHKRAVLAALVCGVSVAAWAGSPHFVRAEAVGPDAIADVVVSFKIARLGDAVTTTVRVSGFATALYACQDGGGSFPSDRKQQEESGPVSNSGEFTSRKNGQLTASLTLSPPESLLECPSGQERVLVSVKFSNIAVSEPSAGTAPASGIFNKTYSALAGAGLLF
jgi:hypothetical protein